MHLHPIMYVRDQYAERDFYELFGFERHYEGDDFPGFVAIRHGSAIIGLQKASNDHAAYATGLRWQFEVDRIDDIDRIISICLANGLEYEVIVEEGGERFRSRSVTVRSPAGITVWFEGPNEADSPE
jgi:catechol 2,3-dioxygenase-like lactoylglutathione lyase family enzyme